MSGIEDACLKEWRRELLEQVHGDVLEIGAGTGANLEFYPDVVLNLVVSEPDASMRKQLQTKVNRHKLSTIQVARGSAEAIEARDGSFDFVVGSLVCCSVTSLDDALIEIRRVLKPGGCLVFMEHVAAEENTKLRWWQNRINPFWRKLAGNCHLNRETEMAIVTAGFNIREIKRQHMETSMALVRPTIRGIAERI